MMMWLERAKHVFKAMDGFGRFLSAFRALRWAPEKHSIDFACVLSPTFLPRYLAVLCCHFRRESSCPQLLMWDMILGQVPPTETTPGSLNNFRRAPDQSPHVWISPSSTETPSPPPPPKTNMVPNKQLTMEEAKNPFPEFIQRFTGYDKGFATPRAELTPRCRPKHVHISSTTSRQAWKVLG